jgi:hypothetical protein
VGSEKAENGGWVSPHERRIGIGSEKPENGGWVGPHKGGWRMGEI